jgi:adenylate kinase family enzyme
MLKQPTIVVICGWPCSGKSTVAAVLRKLIPMHLVDSDQARQFSLGGFGPEWETSEETRRQNQEEMALCYDVAHRIAAFHAKTGRHLMLTYPYTRSTSWKFLTQTIEPYHQTALRVIWCYPGKDDSEFMRNILADRVTEGYSGGSQTYDQYYYGKSQFQPPAVPHKKVLTFLQTPEECARQALEYISADS